MKPDALVGVATEDLVHRRGVAHLGAVERVGQRGERLVRHVHHVSQRALVGELPDLPGPAAHVARAQDERGRLREQRLEHDVVVAHVVLAVGVLDEDEVAGRQRDGGAHAVALALRPVLVEHLHARAVLDLLHQLARAVGRVALDDDDLAVAALDVRGVTRSKVSANVGPR